MVASNPVENTVSHQQKTADIQLITPIQTKNSVVHFQVTLY